MNDCLDRWRQPHNRFEAIWVPSTIAASFRYAMSGSTGPKPAKATQQVLQSHGGLWFNDETFTVSRRRL
jgi:hypothetical protein